MDDLKEVQMCALDIMKDIDKICRANDIQYSLCGGSVIGAKLYSGFIPWDDDIDIMMDRKNYDKFLNIYPTCSKKNYKIVNYRTTDLNEVPALFSRVVDIKTEIVETINNQKNKKGHVFVDITVFDSVSCKISHFFRELDRTVTYIYFYKFHHILPGTKWKQILFRFIPDCIDNQKAIKKFWKYEKRCIQKSKRKTKYCAELLGILFPGKIYTYSLFETFTDILFEGENFMIVKDYEEYLFQRYGRREFTKENKSGMHSHIISFKRI